MKFFENKEWFNILVIILLVIVILLLSYILFFDKLIKSDFKIKENSVNKNIDIKEMEKRLNELDIDMDDILEKLDNS